MAIKTLQTKQVIVEVSKEVAAKLPALAKQNNTTLDALLVDILEEAVAHIPTPAKRIRRKVIANEPILTEQAHPVMEVQPQANIG